MSRSNPNETLQNPAHRFFQWSGDEGNFKYYDKPNKANVTVNVGPKEPFTFLVLATCATIKGYSDSEGSGFWSNEVKDLKTEPLTVRNKSGIVAKGLYENIKDSIKAKGAKFCQSVYIGYKIDGKLEICNIQMTGAALSSWVEFAKNNKIYDIAVQVTGSTEGKKGKTIFKIPTFTPFKVSEKTNQEAIELDKQLQEYLKLYFEKNDKVENIDVPTAETTNTTPKQTASKSNPKEDIVTAEDFGDDEPVF